MEASAGFKAIFHTKLQWTKTARVSYKRCRMRQLGVWPCRFWPEVVKFGPGGYSYEPIRRLSFSAFGMGIVKTLKPWTRLSVFCSISSKPFFSVMIASCTTEFGSHHSTLGDSLFLLLPLSHKARHVVRVFLQSSPIYKLPFPLSGSLLVKLTSSKSY